MSSSQEGSSLTPLNPTLIPLTPSEGSMRHQKSSLPLEGQLGPLVRRQKWFLKKFEQQHPGAPNPSWAAEAQSVTLRTPQNVPAWCVSWSHDPTILLCRLWPSDDDCVDVVQRSLTDYQTISSLLFTHTWCHSHSQNAHLICAINADTLIH